MTKAISALSVVFLIAVSSFVLAGSRDGKKSCGEVYEDGALKCSGQCPKETTCSYVEVGSFCNCIPKKPSLGSLGKEKKKKSKF